jgi:hypothetical protein
LDRSWNLVRCRFSQARTHSGSAWVPSTCSFPLVTYVMDGQKQDYFIRHEVRGMRPGSRHCQALRHGRRHWQCKSSPEAPCRTPCVECLSTIRDVSNHRHLTGRPAAFPDGYGLGTRTDGQDRLRRLSHPPDFQGRPNPHLHGSCHVRHQLLMGTADVNRCGSVRSLMRDHQLL